MKSNLHQLVSQAQRAEADAKRLNRRRQDAIMRGVPHAVVDALYGDPCAASTKAALRLREIAQAQIDTALESEAQR